MSYEQWLDRLCESMYHGDNWRTNQGPYTTDWCAKCSWLKESLTNYGRCDRHNYEVLKVKHHNGNGKPKGLFAGTLTMSPNDPENVETMICAIKKIFSQNTCPVKRYVWYVEYQDNGLPHIHFIYETESSGRIHSKVFKRYWKVWDESKRLGNGFRGGYHKVVDSETAYLEYIEKDGGRHENKWTN